MRELVDAATDCIVAGLDTPSLRVLAGAEPTESQFVIEPLVAATLDELGLSSLMTELPERGALKAMLRRFLDGRLSTRELSSWAHRVIGHDGPGDCRPFVLLDDVYDDWESAGFDLDTLTTQATAEAQAFLDGLPSPRKIGS